MTTFNPFRFLRPGTAAWVKESNEAKHCSVYGCREHRKGLDGYCSKHRSANRRLGHPLARAIPPKEYAGDVSRASKVLEMNLSHPATVHALSHIDRLLKSAQVGALGGLGAAEMRWLADHQVTAIHILNTLAGFYLWQQNRPFPSDKARMVAYSKAVLALAPRPQQVSAKGKPTSVAPRVTALNRIGRQFLDGSWHALVKVHEFVETQQRKAEEARKLPFTDSELSTESHS